MPNYVTMTRAINRMIAPSQVLMNLFFPTSTYKTVETDTVSFDVKLGKRRIAPLCTPFDEAKKVRRDGYQTRTYKLPFISVKDFISTYELSTEKLAGTNVILPEGVSLADIKKQKIADIQLNLKNQVINRVELMIAQMLYGGMDVTGENVNYRIDLGMPNAHKPTRTSTAKWDGSAAKITKDIRDWKRLINRASGLTANIGLLGYEAADAFVASEEVKKNLDANNFRSGALSIEGLDYLGRYAGIDWYERSEQYTNDQNEDVEYINPKSAILHATSAEKTMFWGPVFDEEATSLMPFFSKEKIQDDPSGRTIFVKSSPLPVFNDIGALVTATVL